MNDQITQLKLAQLRIHNEWRAKERALADEYRGKLIDLDNQLRAAAKDTNEIPCLVRWTQGPGQAVYHSADATCGRVRDRSNFTVLPEAEAIAYKSWGLHRCTACGWERAAQIHAGRTGN